MFKKLTIIVMVFTLVILSGGTGFASEINDQVEMKDQFEDQLDGHVITGIEVVGNELIEAEEILAEIETEVGEEIAQDKLQSDMQAIFDLGYFMDLEIAFRGYEDGVMLIFEVVENPMIDEISIIGNQQLSDEELKEILAIEIGEVLNINQLDSGLESVMEIYEDRGYALAQIEDVGMAEENKLQIMIDEGIINDIIIRGNEKTEEYVIRRELDIQPGDVLNIEEMWQDLSKLYNLGYFEDISPNIEGSIEDPSAANLIINVEEGRTGTFSLGGGYSRETGLRGIMTLSEDNLFGKGQRVEADVNLGTKSRRIKLGFADRWAFGSHTSVDTNFNWNRGEGIQGVGEDEYGQRYGADLMLGRPLTDKIKGYVKFDANRLYDYGEDDEMENGKKEDTFSISLQGVRDTRDNRFNPREGTRQQLAVEQGFGSRDFQKASMDLRRYFPVADDHSVALRFKGGVGTADLPGNAKYYLRGQDEVRGYDSSFRSDNSERFSGDSVAMGSIEYRHKILDNLTGVAFFDAGRAFPVRDFKWEDINHSLGAGIRVDTPIGPLGIDYGYALDDKSGDFGIRVGTTF